MKIAQYEEIDRTHFFADHHKVFMKKEQGYQFYDFMGEGGTWYGIATEDILINGKYPVARDSVFAFYDDEIRITSKVLCDLVLIGMYGYKGQTVLGVPVEEEGRLQYIDGCTDSLLIYAPRLGDPCVNHLHFPPGIDQTFHTHPSIRLGYVLRGSGKACFADGERDLKQGDIFCIDVNELHRFRTPDGVMDIIAFHPDSDTGPTDEDHPMKNRTIIPQ